MHLYWFGEYSVAVFCFFMLCASASSFLFFFLILFSFFSWFFFIYSDFFIYFFLSTSFFFFSLTWCVSSFSFAPVYFSFFFDKLAFSTIPVFFSPVFFLLLSYHYLIPAFCSSLSLLSVSFLPCLTCLSSPLHFLFIIEPSLSFQHVSLLIILTFTTIFSFLFL